MKHIMTVLLSLSLLLLGIILFFTGSVVIIPTEIPTVFENYRQSYIAYIIPFSLIIIMTVLAIPLNKFLNKYKNEKRGGST